ncbi:transposase, partial [Agrobacterium vitis]
MPHKHNDNRRHKIPTRKYKVTNWTTYNESLRPRGDLTVWISDEALSQWSAPCRTSRGVQPKYSDLAITMCLSLYVALLMLTLWASQIAVNLNLWGKPEVYDAIR